MIALVQYAVVSAVTVRNSGLLPDRSFRSRLLAVALFLTVGFTVTFLTSWGVDEFLHSLPLPDGMVPVSRSLIRNTPSNSPIVSKVRCCPSTTGSNPTPELHLIQ